MKTIELTQGQVALVNDEDYADLTKYKWHVHKYKKLWYAQRNLKKVNGYSSLGMHRVIMNCPEDMVVDHINHNGLDNRKENLRVCFRIQNRWNTTFSAGVSKYKGVRFLQNRWHAQIGANRKKIHIGYYDTEELAALAYNEAAIKYHKEFAALNIIKGD